MFILEAIRGFWNQHGTKVLGTIQTFLASAQVAAVAVQSMMPQKWQIIIAGANAFFGAWTVKRGFYNSKQANPPA